MAIKRAVRPEPDPIGAEHFRWPVCGAGYEWRRVKWMSDYIYSHRARGSGPVLFPRDEQDADLKNPLLVPDLFRRLAGTRADLDSIRTFADSYGLLGMSVTVLPRSKVIELEPPQVWGNGEASIWKFAIMEMRAAVGVWDAIQVQDEARLRHHFMRWREMDPATAKVAERTRFPGGPNSWIFVGRNEEDRPCYFSGLWGKNRHDEATLNRWDAAVRMLVQLCNQVLVRHCKPFMYKRSARSSVYVLGMEPRNLFGAVWWQFARVISGEATVEPCRVCGTPIEHSRDDIGHRVDRQFCRNACKLKDHRRKVKEAKAMRAGGRPVWQIAKHFDTKISIIENWLTKKK